MDNVSLRHVIRLILNVTGKARLPGLRACRRSAVCRAGGASRAATALDLPRLEALKQCARDCTPSTSINWYNAVPAMPLERRGRHDHHAPWTSAAPLPELLQRLLNNCVVDGDYRCTDGDTSAPAPLNINSGNHC